MAAVFDANSLTSTEKLVALALADHCHDDGSEARPGLARLERKTSLSRDGVRKTMRRLLEKGVLVEDRPATSHRPASYRFVLEALGGSSSVDVVDPKRPSPSPTSVDVVGASVDVVDPIRSTSSTRTVTNRHETSLLLDEDVERAKSRGQTKAEVEALAVGVYERYPRRVGRVEAVNQITRRLLESETVERLDAAIDSYRKFRGADDPKFTMHPARFFGPAKPYVDYAPGGDLFTGRPLAHPGMARQSADDLLAQREREHAESKPMPDKMKQLRKQMRGNL